jgi:hypothetical protein
VIWGRRLGLNPRWTRLDRVLIAWVILCALAAVFVIWCWDWEQRWQGPCAAAMNVFYVVVAIGMGLARDDAPADRPAIALFLMRFMLVVYAGASLLALGFAALVVVFVMNVPWGPVR